MFVVMGITGKVGSTVARKLLASGQSVRAVVRSASKGAPSNWLNITDATPVASLAAFRAEHEQMWEYHRQTLQEFGETRRGWLGVRIQDVTDDMAEAIGLAEAAGALVTDVPEGPALDAGMESGDVILTFDGLLCYESPAVN